MLRASQALRELRAIIRAAVSGDDDPAGATCEANLQTAALAFERLRARPKEAA